MNNSISHYLYQYEEEMPEWLRNYSGPVNPKFSDIFLSRIAYYPGSGFDGTLIKVANMSRSVHSYLYVDYLITKQKLIEHLSVPGCFSHYHSIGRIDWMFKDILPSGLYPYNYGNRSKCNNSNEVSSDDDRFYCFSEIMERNEDESDAVGTKRFVVTFLCADAISSYYHLFCKEYHKAPWIVLLQDHGFGGNYDKFGRSGILDRIIQNNGFYPEFVLCADNTTIWNGYDIVPGLSPVFGGLHNNKRQLYQFNQHRGSFEHRFDCE